MKINRNNLLIKENSSFLILISVFLINAIFYYLNPAKFVPDDSLFYVVIAKYIVADATSSFNGLIETNGYHPLWMIFNVIAVFIADVLSIDPLYVVGFIYQLFVGLSLVYIYKISMIWKKFSAVGTSFVIIFLLMSNSVLQNMESSLALFFVVYTVYSFLTIDNNKKSFFKFGMLLGFVLLSRLDLIFFSVFIAFVYIKKQFRSIKAEPTKLFLFIVGGLLIAVPYLLYNQMYFGSIMPISGALKSSYPLVTFSWHRLFPYGIIVLIASIIIMFISYYEKNRDVNVVLMTLAVSTVVHAFYLALFQFPMTWYFITGYFLLAMVVGYVVKKFESNITIYFVIIFSLVLFSIGTIYLRYSTDFTIRSHVFGSQKISEQYRAQFKLMSENIAKAIPPGSTVLTWDLPGVLAYFGKLNVFSADGLITNRKYQDDLVRVGARKLFAKYNIEYIIVPIRMNGTFYNGMNIKRIKIKGQSGYLITIFSRLHHKRVGSFHVMEKDIIFSTPILPDMNSAQIIGVFKIPTTDSAWNNK